MGTMPSTKVASCPCGSFSHRFYRRVDWSIHGHKIEGKSPSFQDLLLLLIGPAWLMHFLYKKQGFRLNYWPTLKNSPFIRQKRAVIL